MNTATIEALWREYLQTFAEPRVKSELQSRWGGDLNVVQGRIQFSNPPTFQPGYVGSHFVKSRTRILFIGNNPAESKLRSSQEDDKTYAKQLSAFADGNLSFMQLSDFQAGQIVNWPIYREKGIFSETGGTRIALLPADLRPSVRSVALLNPFPFRTVGNKKPLAGYGGGSASLKVHMWECLVRPTIEALAPNFIIRYPRSDEYHPQLEQLRSKPRVVRVLHPGDRNLRAQREKLAESWSTLAELLPNQ